MRSLIVLALLGACTSSSDPNAVQTYKFGPFTIQPSEEITQDCVQITLHNATELYINQVELTTGPGFHHSNWFYVPENLFPGDDGTYNCNDRSFDQAAAAARGGVLFAQSTQSVHDVQTFPEGAALHIPPHFKLVSTIHLLNASDSTLNLTPTIALTPIAKASVTTLLQGVSLENHALGIPPMMQSRFTLDCDFQGPWSSLAATGAVSSPTPDFNLYYALAHYHALGTGMTIEGVRPDGSSATIYATQNHVGDALGGTLDPLFSMDGFTRIRFSCDYYNNTAATVAWGVGSNEMCVFLSFSDSQFAWGGGILLDQAPPAGQMVDNVMTFTETGCQVYSVVSSAS